MVTALVSALTCRPAKPRVAMTGEITLSGQVLPVGGIKEKVLAAKRAGVLEIILPADNEPNVHEDLNEEMLEGLSLHYVKSIREAVDLALEKEPVPVEVGKPTREVALTPVAVGAPN
jgi:ATP-dependent Lon protease